MSPIKPNRWALIVSGGAMTATTLARPSPVISRIAAIVGERCIFPPGLVTMENADDFPACLNRAKKIWFAGVTDGVEAFGVRENVFVAGHYDDRSEFQPLREMHCADRNST